MLQNPRRNLYAPIFMEQKSLSQTFQHSYYNTGAAKSIHWIENILKTVCELAYHALPTGLHCAFNIPLGIPLRHIVPLVVELLAFA